MLESIFRLDNIVALLDILIVATVLYWLMLMFRGTRAERMLWGLSVIVLVYFISQSVELLTLHWILSNFLGSIVIFIIVVFQQDIRKALIQMGKPFSSRDVIASKELIEEVARAVTSMSKKKTGGLVVIERSMELNDFINIGADIDAKVSKELLLSIFNPQSPLHDGAVIIKGGRVFRAGCILPLTDKELTKSMGTRHRAAVGLAEETDAVIIVVSEETGEITLVFEEEVKAGLDAERLISDLNKLFMPSGDSRKSIFPWRAGA